MCAGFVNLKFSFAGQVPACAVTAAATAQATVASQQGTSRTVNIDGCPDPDVSVSSCDPLTHTVSTKPNWSAVFEGEHPT